MATKANPRQVLEANKLGAQRLVSKVGYEGTRKLMLQAQKDLEGRLRDRVKGPGDMNFTTEQMKVTLVQVREILREVTPGLKATVVDTSRRASEMAAEGTIDYLKVADEMFRGVGTQPLALDEARMFDAAAEGANASVLRRLASSGEPVPGASEVPSPAKYGILDRYGMGVIEDFESTLKLGVIARKPWATVREEIIDSSDFLQGKPMYWAERIVRTECLVGDTLVSGAVVRAVSRRWYEGDVFEIVTERGRKFTTTPNHPMLTTHAWVSSKMLNPGDHLVGYVGDKDSCSSGDDDVEGGPATIREIFDSLSTVGVMEHRRGSYPDFHGDGRDGDVDILRPHRELKFGNFAALYESIVKNVFSPTYFSNAGFCHQCGRLLSIDKQPCECGITYGDSSLLETQLYNVARSAKGLRNILGSFASIISLYNFINREVCAVAGVVPQFFESQFCGVTLRPSDTFTMYEPFYPIGGAANSGGYLRGAQSGEIELDCILSITVRHFEGHVYNLTTPDGYFAINGVYTGNCMAAYNRAGWEATREADEQLDDMVKILSATFDDRTGPDSKNVHGMVRRPDEAFEYVDYKGAHLMYQHPPNRPNDREIVVPHRISWAIPPYLKVLPDGAVAAAYAAKKIKYHGRPAVMTTVPFAKFGV